MPPEGSRSDGHFTVKPGLGQSISQNPTHASRSQRTRNSLLSPLCLSGRMERKPILRGDKQLSFPHLLESKLWNCSQCSSTDTPGRSWGDAAWINWTPKALEDCCTSFRDTTDSGPFRIPSQQPRVLGPWSPHPDPPFGAQDPVSPLRSLATLTTTSRRCLEQMKRAKDTGSLLCWVLLTVRPIIRVFRNPACTACLPFGALPRRPLGTPVLSLELKGLKLLTGSDREAE